MYKIEWVGTKNFWKGRDGKKIIAIVNHITAGLYPGCLGWLKNPTSKASANYLVLKDGSILQLVKDEDSAWANGKVNKPNWKYYDGTNPNRYTLSIEHEALQGEGLTEQQYRATLYLHHYLVIKHDIPIDEDHIIGHYRIDSVDRINCPGSKFPWKELFKDLKKDYLFHWAEKYIDKSIAHGFISGYQDGTFKPDNPLLRGEYARILSFVIDKIIYFNYRINELENRIKEFEGRG